MVGEVTGEEGEGVGLVGEVTGEEGASVGLAGEVTVLKEEGACWAGVFAIGDFPVAAF